MSSASSSLRFSLSREALSKSASILARTAARIASSDFEAVFLGELVVDLQRLRRRDLLHRHVELGLLAGEIRRGVIVGEARLHDALLALGGALQLLLEARDEHARAQHEIDVAAGAALEGHAVELALEVDRELVALLGLGAFVGLGSYSRSRSANCFIAFSTSSSETGATGRSSEMSSKEPISKLGSVSKLTTKAKSPEASSTSR